MVYLLFGYFATVSILAGVLTVALRSPVHCGLALLTLLLHIAGLFVFLHRKFPFLLFAGLAILGELLILMFQSPYAGAKGKATTEVILAVGNSHAIGLTMFSDYLLLFEIVGVFLLGAIIGAIVLAKTPTTPVAKTDAPL